MGESEVDAILGCDSTGYLESFEHQKLLDLEIFLILVNSHVQNCFSKFLNNNVNVIVFPNMLHINQKVINGRSFLDNL